MTSHSSKSFLVIATLAAATGCSGYLKPPEPPRRLTLSAPAQHQRHDNGLQLLVLPDPAARTVHVELRYLVGSSQDPLGRHGLAHLIEHLMFAARTESGDRVQDELTRLALWWNASTTHDRTRYYLRVHPESVGEAVELLAGRMRAGCAGIEQADLDRVREIALNELREDRVSPGEQIRRLLHEAVYPPGHPYRRPVLGDEESLARISLADVCSFVDTYYHPGNAIVVLSGAVQKEQASALASSKLADIPRGEVVPSSPPPLTSPGRRDRMRQLPIDEPVLLVAWPMPRDGTREHYLAHLAMSKLDGSVTRFANTYEWGYGASVYEIGGGHAPALVLQVKLRSPDKAAEALEAIEKSRKWVQRALWRDTPSARKAWRRRLDNERESLLKQYEGVAGRASFAAHELQYRSNPSLLAGRLNEIASFQGPDARAVAGEMLAMHRARVLLIVPGDDAAAHRSPEDSYQPGEEPAHKAVLTASAADAYRDVELPIQPRARPVDERRLANGLRILLWPHGSVPVVHGALIVDAGSAREPAGLDGLATFVGRATDDHNAYSESALSSGYHHLLRSLSHGLRLLRTNLGETRRAELVRRLRTPLRTRLRQHQMRLARALYGDDHPYARGWRMPETVARLNGDRISAWERANMVAGRSTLVLAGQFDVDLAFKHIVYQFKHLSRGSEAAPIPTARRRSGAAFVATKTGDAPTIRFDLSFLGAPGVGDDMAARLVLSEMLTGELDALREDLAVTYGFQAGYSPAAAGGRWWISGYADAERSEEAARALMRVLEKLRADPSTWAARFATARKAVIDELITTEDSGASVFRQLYFIAEHDLPTDYPRRLLRSAARLRPADVQRLIAGELRPEHQVFGALGPAASVSAAERAVGGTPVVSPPAP